MAESTGKPELTNGYIQIANELQEAISRAKFTAYERSLLDLVIRLSYGCRQSLFADLLHWSDMEVVGIPKQKARQTAEALKDKKIIKITYPQGRIRLRLNKYYLTWNVTFAEKEQIYEKLILLNLDDNKPSDENGNLQVTTDEKSNLQVTSEGGSNLQVTGKVTYRLPESNLQVTQTGDKAALSQDLQAPKEKKERREKKSPQKISNIVSNSMDGLSDPSEGGGESKSEKEKARDRSKEVETLQGLIIATFHPQITAEPPYAACRSAIDKFGFDILKAAADEVSGKALDKTTPQAALNYVIGCARRIKTPGIDYAQRNKIRMRIQDLKAELRKGEADTDLTKFEGVAVQTGNGPVIVEDKEAWMIAMQNEINRLIDVTGG